MPVPYFDAHCDTITKFRPLRQSGKNHLDLERLSQYAPCGQVLALWGAPHMDSARIYRLLLRTAEHQIGKNGDIAKLCTSAGDYDAAVEQGKIALFLAVEGANLLSCSVAGMLDAYRSGVRLVTLCWNYDNRLCGAARDSGSGLTADGVRFVNACWERGMAVDLSHASEQTFWDVLAIARRPVICTHSDAKKLCAHFRNLTNEQIEAMIRNNGCIGVNLCPDFLGRGRSLDTVIEHIEYYLNLGAEQNLCLGTDFDGIDALPSGITGVESMAELYDALLRRGLSEETVQRIFYRNLRDYLERALVGGNA